MVGIVSLKDKFKANTDLGSSHKANCNSRVDVTARDVSHGLEVGPIETIWSHGRVLVHAWAMVATARPKARAILTYWAWSPEEWNKH